MASIRITANRFRNPQINTTQTVDFSMGTFFRSILTLGMQKFPNVAAVGWRSMMHRLGIGLAACSFLEDRLSHLSLAPEYRGLDRSEKVVLSYWFGMVFAKFVAETTLSIRWLTYADTMRAQGALTTNPASRERGDFVGQDQNGRWHVMEAKARANPYSPDLIEDAKGQASRITTITGRPPASASACITELWRRPISIVIEDPDPNPDEEMEWIISEEKFFSFYYGGIINYIREWGTHKRVFSELEFITAPLWPIYEFSLFPLHALPPIEPLEVGLLAPVFETPTKAPTILQGLKELDHHKIGLDGVAILGNIPEWTKSKTSALDEGTL